MSLPAAASLEAFSLAELREVVGRLVGEVRRLQSDNAALREANEAQQATISALRAENQALRDEVAYLKGLPPRPPLRPSGMEQATQPGAADKGATRPKPPRGVKRDAQAITAGHRQLGAWAACEMELSQVGGRNDNVRCSQLRRLPFPG